MYQGICFQCYFECFKVARRVIRVALLYKLNRQMLRYGHFHCSRIFGNLSFHMQTHIWRYKFGDIMQHVSLLMHWSVVSLHLPSSDGSLQIPKIV
jgi:hypothetical protein